MKRLRAATLVFLALGATSALPQSYPTKPVRIIVIAGPGSAPDVRARQIANRFPEFLGQTLIVENKGGGQGIIAAEAAARAPADGHTLLLGGGQTHALNPWLFEKLPYRPEEDFVPITSVSKGYWLIATNVAVPANSISELLQLAKSRPGKLRYGSTGDGSYAHLFMERIKAIKGIDVSHIPYKTGAAEITDLVSGRIEIGLETETVFGPHIKAGKLKALAVAGPNRVASIPDVPTLSEAGIPNLDINVWLGIFAPAGTPAGIVRRLRTEIAKILNMPEIRTQIISSGSELGGESPEEFAAFVRNERAKWGKIIREVRIPPR